MPEPAAAAPPRRRAAATESAASPEATDPPADLEKPAAAADQPAAGMPATTSAAAPPAPAPTEVAPLAASPASGTDELRAAWPAIVAALSQSPPVKPLIAACRPVSLEGNVVTLGFPEDQAFLRDALERRRTMLEEGIGKILGRAVSVHCVATNLEHVPAVPLGETADLITEARRIFADDLVDVGEVS